MRRAVSDFLGTSVTLRCIGVSRRYDFRRCPARYRGQAGWDFVSVYPLEGWICPACRLRFKETFSGPGLPRPLHPPGKKSIAFGWAQEKKREVY